MQSVRDAAIIYAMYAARDRAYLSRCLADAFLAGGWDHGGLLQRAAQVLDRRPRWLPELVRDVLTGYHRPPADRPRELAGYIAAVLAGLGDELEDDAGPDAAAYALRPPGIRRWLVPEPAMGPRRWPVPEIASVGALAEFLGVSDGHLAWMADARSLERAVADERLRHYSYATIPRRRGPVRVIERPKHRLKAIQRRILHEILDWIPVHPAAHGFTRGRSVASHASAHVGQRVVVRFDLQDFFASIAAGRVFGIFRTAGYPEAVAHTLTALTSNVVPSAVSQAIPRPVDPTLVGAHHRLTRRLATPHLPQGAPTSPSLANLAAFTLDRRLGGLADSLELSYSRYADDLTFSGSSRLLNAAGTLRAAVATIVRDEGFAVNDAKAALATRAGRQQVCGVVVNARLNVPRSEYDTLKAILHNAAVHGPATQNLQDVPDFRAHLLGRIAWVESLNPERGRKLRAAFARIDWEGGSI